MEALITIPEYVLFPREGKNKIIPVKELTAEEANKYAEQLKQEFIKHWQKEISK